MHDGLLILLGAIWSSQTKLSDERTQYATTTLHRTIFQLCRSTLSYSWSNSPQSCRISLQLRYVVGVATICFSSWYVNKYELLRTASLERGCEGQLRFRGWRWRNAKRISIAGTLWRCLCLFWWHRIWSLSLLTKAIATLRHNTNGWT